ncbi:MAG: WYL domain-containing protein [Deltaproteobacteria bacterium]|nr:WYL domain-containing protein [Deltaproteobacteria bacterium]
MNKTLYRHWLILRALRRHPAKTSALEIEGVLGDLKIRVTRRTIERDLCDLMRHPYFPIGHDDNKPRGWYWTPAASIMDIPAMEPSTALTFHILEHFTNRLLPKSICDKLAPYQARAAEVLKALPESKFAKWPAKVRYLPRGQALAPAKIDNSVLERVYEALLYEKKLLVWYCAAHRSKPIELLLHPLGLVIREPVVYLVAVADGHPDPYVYLLHRMQKAEVIQELRAVPKGFDLDAFINSGALGVRLAERPANLRLRFLSDGAEKFLSETPLSKDQIIETAKGGHKVLRATVPDTLVLRSFLLGFEDSVEVLAPESLRKDLRDAARRMAKLYSI